MPKAYSHQWRFKARFRARLRVEVAAGDPAGQGSGRRDRKIARKDRVLAAEGASPSSSGSRPRWSRWTAPRVRSGTRSTPRSRRWSQSSRGRAPMASPERPGSSGSGRYQKDEIPYIEILGDLWGELCASKEVASQWADQLLGMKWMARARTDSGALPGTTGA